MPTSPIDFCVLADLKSWLGLTTTNDDALLQRLITNISQSILTKISRDAIVSANYTESYDGSGTPTQALIHYPITAVASLLINNTPIVASPDGVQAGFLFDRYVLKLVGAGSAWALSPGFYGPPSTFIAGKGNVKVTYTAGYAAVPGDLAQFAMEWCAFRYRAKGWIGQKSKHLQTGETVTFSDDKMTEAMEEVIKPYKRRIPV
jgi:Phage gp6-like head-tail connector protein